jgi:hypothetical protein
MTRNSFIFKYLGYALAPHLLAIGLVLQLTVSSWQMDGQAFANWPAPLLYKTMAVLFVLLNAILWTFWGGYKVARERGVQQYQPALVPLNLAALAFSLGGHLYLTELLAGAALAHMAVLYLGGKTLPGAAKSETTASFS